MKFRILASIFVLVVVIVLTLLFAGSTGESTDQTPVSGEIQLPN